MWLKLFWQHPLIPVCADKYKMREYVTERGCGAFLPKLYGVYKRVSEIDFSVFPEKFVIKCNHGCGYNIICTDKSNFDEDWARKQLTKWMKERYGLKAAEIHYDRIDRRIICEEYIDTPAGVNPIDYKIYCFNGEPQLVLVCTDRNTRLKLNVYDAKWNKMDVLSVEYSNNDIQEKPASLNLMFDIARKLSRGFPFVRIDFYERECCPIIGEMTFTPVGCMSPCYSEHGNKILGEFLKLPPEKYRYFTK